MRSLRWVVVVAGLVAVVPFSLADTLLEEALAVDERKGTARDAAKAAALYQRAADGGDAFAHLRLGNLYETGDGVPQDYARARQHYQAAVDGGVAEARVRLGLCLLEGWGGPVDRTGFGREITLAAEAGVPTAQRMLGSMFGIGLGVPKDAASAVRWLERAAAQGDTWATYAVGREAESGRLNALMPSKPLAKEWYQLSAEREYVDAMRAMARTLMSGQAEQSTWEIGRKWLELATESGDSEAPYILALAEMLRPRASSGDEARARAWITLASERGNERATEVAELLQSGRPMVETLRYVLNVPFEERYVRRSFQKRQTSSTGDQRPAVVKLVEPVYPESLRILRAEGKVVVEFIVNTTGRVASARAVQSSHPLFAERAVRAVQQWRFEPGMKDGRLVNTKMQVPVYFQSAEEQADGIDGALRAARNRARELGGRVAEDVEDLKPAKVIEPGPFPSGALAAGARGMLLLVIDGEGRPVRGHVLHAQPAEFADEVLRGALQGRYEAEAGGAEGHVMLLFNATPPRAK